MTALPVGEDELYARLLYFKINNVERRGVVTCHVKLCSIFNGK